jgi:AcrR family transcriptional regulator
MTLDGRGEACQANIDTVNIGAPKDVTERRSKAVQRAAKAGAIAARKAGPAGYHHGSLREALLQAAERILERDGIQRLTLRAAAREVGVSHAAPKNHFGDLSGLLSELAALGFERFTAMMLAKVRHDDVPARRMEAIGQGYVAFARAHPGLFVLMFRSERLDMSRPALRKAASAAANVLSGAVGARRDEKIEQVLTLPQAASIVGAWSLVHGFAMLLLDGRLKQIMVRLPRGTRPDMLLASIFRALQPS